jgi:hypothetical protein
MDINIFPVIFFSLNKTNTIWVEKTEKIAKV